MEVDQIQTFPAVTDRAVAQPVVVGIGDSPAGTAALHWAEAETYRDQATLWAVRVHDDRHPAALSIESSASGELQRVRLLLFAMVADRLSWRTKRAKIVMTAIQGPLVPTLARATHGAKMLVIGQPTAPEHLHLPEELARHCSCPVAVVGTHGSVRFVPTVAPPRRLLIKP